MDICFITTGGTIDKVYFDASSDYEVGESVVDDLLYGSRSARGRTADAVFALDLANGQLRWEHQAANIAQGSIAIGDGRLFFAEVVGVADRQVDEPRWLDVVTDRGTFRISLDLGTAPITAREIWDLAEEGFYDDLSFHRVVPNFVIQGGDPRGDGWGGPGFVIPDEPSLVPFDSWRVGIATSGPRWPRSACWCSRASRCRN